MNKFLLFTVVAFFTMFAEAQRSDLKIFVTLTPAGDFTAKSRAVKGVVVQKADGSFVAENVEVDLESLQTGISLRDDHMKEKYLETKKYPKAILKKAVGKNDKGVGLLNIKGKDVKVSGTYKKEDKLLVAEFTLMLADIGITDVNYKGVGVDEEVKIEIAMPIVAEGSSSAVPTARAVNKVAPKKAPLKKPKSGKK